MHYTSLSPPWDPSDPSFQIQSTSHPFCKNGFKFLSYIFDDSDDDGDVIVDRDLDGGDVL